MGRLMLSAMMQARQPDRVNENCADQSIAVIVELVTARKRRALCAAIMKFGWLIIPRCYQAAHLPAFGSISLADIICCSEGTSGCGNKTEIIRLAVKI